MPFTQVSFPFSDYPFAAWLSAVEWVEASVGLDMVTTMSKILMHQRATGHANIASVVAHKTGSLVEHLFVTFPLPFLRVASNFIWLLVTPSLAWLVLHFVLVKALYACYCLFPCKLV